MFFLQPRREQRRDDTDIVSEANISLMLCSFIGTAVLFFTGLVILNLKSLPHIVELPVVYLIISAVAFIIAAVIYANVSGMSETDVSRSETIQAANWISEYPGIYLFLIAIPLLILGVTESILVHFTTAIVCYGSLFLYGTSRFSLDHRRYQKKISKVLSNALLLAFCIAVYSTALSAPASVLPVGVVLLAVVLGISHFSSTAT